MLKLPRKTKAAVAALGEEENPLEEVIFQDLKMVEIALMEDQEIMVGEEEMIALRKVVTVVILQKNLDVEDANNI